MRQSDTLAMINNASELLLSHSLELETQHQASSLDLSLSLGNSYAINKGGAFLKLSLDPTSLNTLRW